MDIRHCFNRPWIFITQLNDHLIQEKEGIYEGHILAQPIEDPKKLMNDYELLLLKTNHAITYFLQSPTSYKDAITVVLQDIKNTKQKAKDSINTWEHFTQIMQVCAKKIYDTCLLNVSKVPTSPISCGHKRYSHTLEHLNLTLERPVQLLTCVQSSLRGS